MKGAELSLLPIFIHGVEKQHNKTIIWLTKSYEVIRKGNQRKSECFI